MVWELERFLSYVDQPLPIVDESQQHNKTLHTAKCSNKD
jgi:hypothetical protein